MKGLLLATVTPGPVGNPFVDGRGALNAIGAATAAGVPVLTQVRTLFTPAAVGATVPLLATWTRSPWSGTTWTGKSWTATPWTTSAWNGTSWTTSAWNGTTWTGTTWTGASWNGTTWTTSAWNGTTWTGTSWTGANWYSSLGG
jgi:serine protease AprX